jgi:hypothetical protein
MNTSTRPERLSNSRTEPRYAPYRDLAVIYEGHSEAMPVRAPDISPHGIFINTPLSFPEGAVLSIEFRLTRSNIKLKIRGEVRYCLPGVGIGVEFINISSEARRAIEEEMSARYGVLSPVP